MGDLATAIERWSAQRAGAVGHPVGWEVGVAVHPNTSQRVVLGARRVEDGRVSLLDLGLIEILGPYTDEEVRAMVMHRWEREEDPPPHAVRLAAALLATERWRC